MELCNIELAYWVHHTCPST